MPYVSSKEALARRLHLRDHVVARLYTCCAVTTVHTCSVRNLAATGWLSLPLPVPSVVPGKAGPGAPAPSRAAVEEFVRQF